MSDSDPFSLPESPRSPNAPYEFGFSSPDPMQLNDQMPSIEHTSRPLGPLQATNIVFSSDPIQGNPTPSFSAGAYRLNTDRKRQRPLSSLSEDTDYTPTPPTSHTETLVLRARDLLVEAVTCSKSRDEQSRLLDLIEIFREYSEKGRI